MPDQQRHRGAHPADAGLFDSDRLDQLRSAVAHLSWLLSRGYALDSALKLVGDRFDLTQRQRMAVRRSACTDGQRAQRQAARASVEDCRGHHLSIDGYNVLISVESALSGGLIMIGRDGATRDLASVHGTYRRVEETKPALALLFDQVAAMGIDRVDWYLDKPVSNSGRLKQLMAEMLDARRPSTAPPPDPPWNIELADDPDSLLKKSTAIVATSDADILDHCHRWIDLPAVIIQAQIPSAWIIDLQFEPTDAG